MTKDEWRKAIVDVCEEAGTYRRVYDHVIDTLASIMEKRDEAERQYVESGSRPLGMYTNKAGAKNIVVNPILKAINELNAQALAYWRDLGLTPAGMKKIAGDVVDKQGEGAFEAILARLEE